MFSIAIGAGKGQRKRIEIRTHDDDASEFKIFFPVDGWIAVLRHGIGSGIVFISWHKDPTAECDPVDITWRGERFKFFEWAAGMMADEAAVFDTGVHGEALAL